MLEQLKHQRDLIALESNSGAVALESAINRLPDLFAAVRAAFSKYLGHAPALPNEMSPVQNFYIHDIEDQNYAKLRSIEIVIPAGMKSDYLQYAKALENGGLACLHFNEDMLLPFNAWLNDMLGSPQKLRSISGNVAIPKYRAFDFTKVQEQINDCFVSTGVKESTGQYGKHIKRNADWTATFRALDSTRCVLNMSRHEAIVAKVNDTTAKMDLLMHRIQEDPQTYALSAATLNSLANNALQIGQGLEFYGLMRHRMNEMAETFSQLRSSLYQYMQR